MSNNTANIDENDVKTWVAYNETTGLTERVYVDPTLGALLIFVVPTETATYTPILNAKHDGNDVATVLGYNETTGLTEALRSTDSGALLVKSV